MNASLVILDIGSSLVEGPARGPASQIAAAGGLTTDQKHDLHQMLMTAPYAGPEDVYAAVRERLGLVSPAVESAIAEVWDAQEGEARLIPGVTETLERLVERGYQLALLSNIWTPYYRSVYRLIGGFFDLNIPPELRLLSCLEGLVKPAPELFRRVLDRAKASPAKTLMVGDSYDKDIRPAIECGMSTLWLLHSPDREIPALVEVLNGAAAGPTAALRTLADINLEAPWLASLRPDSNKENPHSTWPRAPIMHGEHNAY